MTSPSNRIARPSGRLSGCAHLEQRGAAEALSALPRPLLLLLALPFARLAAHREGERPQSSLRDLALAFDTGSVLALVEQKDRTVDPAQVGRRPVEQGALDVILNLMPPRAEHLSQADISDGVSHPVPLIPSLPLEVRRSGKPSSSCGGAVESEQSGHAHDPWGRMQGPVRSAA